ncbi:hypothetical protein ACFL9U_12270 [Thermodesulfobacteriota bacterium]
MNNAIKGALLSGLLFPGLGQVILKHYKRGVVLMLSVLTALTVVVVVVVQQALTILEKIELEEGGLEMSAISDAVAQASNTSYSRILNFVSLLIIFCWIFGIVDAYRIGRKRDLEEQATSHLSNSNGE